MSKRAKRQSALGRQKAVDWGKRRIYLIVCEGETEKRYFDTMRGHPDIQIHAVHVRQAKHPQRERVIRTAQEAERSNYAEIWAVFDTDGEDVAVLCEKARQDGIRTAASTPTFEAWLLLHLTDQRAALMSGAKAEKALKALLPNWGKGRTRFEDFADGLQDALERAERLPPGTDPSTGVHRLVRAILRG
ncbi:RloB family protein [Nocardiopsis valliformis]|uniref:RloB family protein n=1 Tax=Nocardiopsis valliformis TaxID=239974 RepID=UPI000345F74A|nr:RloB family protein [Nocardiopsis valliformis]